MTIDQDTRCPSIYGDKTSGLKHQELLIDKLPSVELADSMAAKKVLDLMKSGAVSIQFFFNDVNTARDISNVITRSLRLMARERKQNDQRSRTTI